MVSLLPSSYIPSCVAVRLVSSTALMSLTWEEALYTRGNVKGLHSTQIKLFL